MDRWLGLSSELHPSFHLSNIPILILPLKGMQKILALCFIVFSTYSGMSQTKDDTLFFMNGEFLTAKVIDTANFMVHCKYLRKGKERDLSIDRERLFGIKYGNGDERIYYYYDTMVGNYFTVEETKRFIYGEHDAIRGYHPRMDFVGGFLVGFAVALKISIDDSVLYSIPTIITPIPVFAYTAVVTLVPRIRGNKKKITNQAYIKDDSYLIGYERIARKKKFFSALSGGVAGILAATVVNIFAFHEKIQ